MFKDGWYVMHSVSVLSLTLFSVLANIEMDENEEIPMLSPDAIRAAILKAREGSDWDKEDEDGQA